MDMLQMEVGETSAPPSPFSQTIEICYAYQDVQTTFIQQEVHHLSRKAPF